MTKVIDAIFDGEVFRPVEMVKLEPNTTVQIHFDDESETAGEAQFDVPATFQEWVDRYAGTYDGPED